MGDPPTPITPAALLAAFGNMTGWTSRATSPSGTGYGRGHNSGGADVYLWPHQNSADVEWTSGSSLPSDAFDCLMPEATYNVLHGGSLGTDGRISYGGSYYRIAMKNVSGIGSAAIAVSA